MRGRRIPSEQVKTNALILLLLTGASISTVSAGQADAPPRGLAVYVRDFEMSLASATEPDPASASYTNKPNEDLQLHSRQVQDHFAETLVEALQKKGYSSSRKQALPGNGILLEGVFAEPDKKNRIRRALLGSGSPGAKLTLYVGVFDKKSVSQPLYIEAPVQEPDPNYGPVITLNAYIPMAKYEINKDIAEEDVRNICAQITADVTALVTRSQVSNVQ